MNYLQQGSANCSLWIKSGPLSVFVQLTDTAPTGLELCVSPPTTAVLLSLPCACPPGQQMCISHPCPGPALATCWGSAVGRCCLLRGRISVCQEEGRVCWNLGATETESRADPGTATRLVVSSQDCLSN